MVGGGAVGLACAWYLRREGADVVVLERGRCGEGASLGNAGWITPGLSNPIPAPGVMAQALRWLAKRDSPLLLRPRLDPAFAAWCWRFMRSSRRERYLEGMRALLALNRRTLELFDGLRSDGVEFEMHEDGLLFLFLSVGAVEEEAAVLADLAREGYPGAVRGLSTQEAQALEPAVNDAVAGAIYLPAERHVRPETLCAGLATALRTAGAEVREGADVRAFERRGGEWRLRAGTEDVVADRVVVAAGAWTGRLLHPLGVRIRQEAAKGYSVTAVGRGTPPRLPLYFGEAKVGCSPFAGGVRLAGTLELAGLDLSIDRRRLAAVSRSASTYLRGWLPERPELEWAGLRPLPADSLPLIGGVPGHDGLFVATGHGMLGITLAPSTGAALAPLVLGGRPEPELVPLAVAR